MKKFFVTFFTALGLAAVAPVVAEASIGENTARNQVVSAESNQCGGTAGSSYRCISYPTAIYSQSDGGYWWIQINWHERWNYVGTLAVCHIIVDVPKSGSGAWKLVQRASC